MSDSAAHSHGLNHFEQHDLHAISCHTDTTGVLHKKVPAPPREQMVSVTQPLQVDRLSMKTQCAIGREGSRRHTCMMGPCAQVVAPLLAARASAATSKGEQRRPTCYTMNKLMTARQILEADCSANYLREFLFHNFLHIAAISDG